MTDSPPKSTAWDILIIFLSIYTLGALFALTVFPISPDVREILWKSDFFICFFFLADFFKRLAAAPSKLAFMKWGWVDLISSIPAVDALRWGRLLRLVRLLRAVRSLRYLVNFFYEMRARSTVVAAVAIIIVLVVFSAITVLQFEKPTDSTINDGSDAIWWAIATVSTVGYGDATPTSTPGRIVGIVLMICGVGLFGVLSGALAAWFVSTDEAEDSRRLRQIEHDLTLIKQHLGIQESAAPPASEDSQS